MKSFFIKKNSQLPILLYPLTQKNMEDNNITDDMMQNVAVTFTLYDTINEEYLLLNVPAYIKYRKNIEDEYNYEKYSLYYKFSKEDTNVCGNYIGEFKLTFMEPFCGVITFPSNGYIDIIIQNSHTKVDIV